MNPRKQHICGVAYRTIIAAFVLIYRSAVCGCTRLYGYVKDLLRTQTNTKQTLLFTCCLLLALFSSFSLSGQSIVLSKTASNPTPDVEEVFNYVLDLSCSSSTGPCRGVVIRDTIPEYLQFLNFSNPLPSGVASATYDVTTREAVITFDNNVAAGSSIQLNIQVLFPDGTLDGSVAVNTAYASSIDAGTDVSSATATAQNGRTPGDFPDNKDGGTRQVTGGYQYWRITIGNIGFSTIDNYSIIDTIPAGITLDQIRTPEFANVDHAGSLYYQRSDDPGVWYLWSAINLNNRQNHYVSGLSLPVGEYVTIVRLDLNSVSGSGIYNPYIYPDGFRSGWVLYAFETGGRVIGDTFTNCAYYSGTSGGFPIRDVDCITTTISPPENEVGGNGYSIGDDGNEQVLFSIEDTMDVALEFYSESNMGFDIVGGVMAVVLPPSVSYIPNSWYFDWGEDNADYQTPIVETETLIDGRELVRFVFDSIHNNSFTIEPNPYWEGFRIVMSTFISPAAMQGSYDLEYYYYAAHSTHDNCNVNDVDNYLGGYSTFVCNENQSIDIIRPPGSAGLESRMEVIGTLDMDYSQYPDRALTVPGGISDYRITIKNPNADQIDQLVFITVLPHLLDAEVLDENTPRYSEWQPTLAEAVVTGIPQLDVEYSTETNPCRDDLAGSNPTPFPTGCTTANWSATPPSDITDVTALRFDYGNRRLAENDSLVVSFSMRSPVDALPDTSIAWNSFAYAARNWEDFSDLLPAEPIKVGIELRPGNVPIVGDFVWEDLEPNGRQDIGEVGIDGVRVELYHDVNNNGVAEPTGPDSLELWTVTSAGGKYLFSDFDYGRYFIVFSDLPSGYNPTYQDAAPDTLDSDGLISPVMLFDNTTIDYSHDLGLYIPEDCTNGLDDDGDGLGDCFDCDDCFGAIACGDNDSDGVGDFCDLDDDNDGIPDSIECMATAVFSDLGSAYTTDNTVSIISQNISNVNPYGFGNTLRIGNLITRDDVSPISSDYVSVTVSYAGIIYAYFQTQEGIKTNNPSIIYSNGASGSLGVIPYSIAGTESNSLDIFFPSSIPNSGLLEVVIDMNDKDSSPSDGVDDVTISNLSMFTCLDSDSDGLPNFTDLDSDNDGLYDAIEAGHGVAQVDGVLVSSVGSNGLVDILETSIDSDIINYTISDSESTPDGLYDAYVLDSDGDACFDTDEESISDSDNDGVAGLGTPSVDGQGLVLGISYSYPSNNIWQDPDIGFCIPEICDDGIDNDFDGLIDCFDCESCGSSSLCGDNDGDGVSDYCDLDDDNDGIPDLIECSFESFGPELVVNGNFENGYAYWTSEFNRGRNNNGPTRDGCSIQGWIALSPCASSNGTCDEYYSYYGSTPDGSTVITDPLGSGANVLSTNACVVSNGHCMAQVLPDHTTGTGLSLYVDPSDIPGRSYWKQGVTVQSNKTYEFSAWLMVIEEDPNLQFKINNVALTTGFNLNRLSGGSNGPDVWQHFSVRWNSNTTSGIVDIELVNLTAGCQGNDLRLDDVSLREVINNCDCDGDGVLNFFDLDSDNDGIYDLYEAGHTAIDGDNNGVIDGSDVFSGSNGLYNSLETITDNGILNYTVADSESSPNGVIDACELDSDGDGCFDTREESISDPDNDGLVGSSTPTVNEQGLVDGYSYSDPPNNFWQNPSLFRCLDLTGQIFEDLNYGGGDGRDYNTANMAAVSSGWTSGDILIDNVRLELYDNTGAFVDATTTNASGQYTFSDVGTGAYSVRVVTETITSNRGSNATGQAIISSQTFRYTGSVAFANEVGGANPSLIDAGENTTSANISTLYAGSTTVHSLSIVTIGSSSVGGVDFGYNFDVIVNENNAGQGSLRQFIINSNELDNSNLDQEDNPTSGVSFAKPAGTEHSIFMISGSGTHTITPSSVLPALSDDYTHLSGYTQDGSSQGVIGSRANTIELSGNSALFDGLSINANHITISGLVVNEFRTGITGNASRNNSFIWGNYIGTSTDGLSGLGNSSVGINLQNFSSSFIGTNGDNINDANEGNLVSDNAHGIQLRNASNILIAGNIIGLNSSGTAAISNSFNGIYIRDATGPNIIGFDDNATSNTAAHFRNVSSGNGNDGVRLFNASNQIIAGNYFGTDVTGAIRIGNGNYGVQLTGTDSDNIIGTDSDGDDDVLERNIISGNGSGIRLASTGSGSDNVIAGNFIGTDVTGNTALGNLNHGLEINGLFANSIVGTDGDNVRDAIERNIISGNIEDGIRLAATTGNVIAGNYIGLGVDGTTAVGNGDRGILIATTATGNVVGYSPSMANSDELIVGNLIKNNGDSGIGISGTGNQNRISRNQLSDNLGLGIDLGYDLVTSNDNGDGDIGANNFYNFPVMTSISLLNNNLTISGFAPPGSNIEFFVADAGPNPSPLPLVYTTSFGEGSRYLFTVQEGGAQDGIAATGVYNNDGTGVLANRTQSRFNFTIDVTGMGISDGIFLTATATDVNNNTSEFSGITEVILNCGTALTNPHIMYFRRR